VDVGDVGFHSLSTSPCSSGSDSASCLLCLLMVIGDGCGTAGDTILSFSAKQICELYVLMNHDMTWQCFR
jgi:hypothetical protein